MGKSVKRKKTLNQRFNRPLKPTFNVVLIEKRKRPLAIVAEKILWAEFLPGLTALYNHYLSKRTKVIESGEIILFLIILGIAVLFYILSRIFPDPDEKLKKQITDLFRKSN